MEEPDVIDIATTSSSDAIRSLNKKGAREVPADESGPCGDEIGSTESVLGYETTDIELSGLGLVAANMETIGLRALHTDDDPTMNPWTFRMFFLGMSFYIRVYHIALTHM